MTTPQDAAIQVTERGGVMYQKLKVPIIGIVENMSSVKCPSCSEKIGLFGSGAEKLANRFSTSILGRLPLNLDISTAGDEGVPVVIAKPDSEESLIYKDIAIKLILFLND